MERDSALARLAEARVGRLATVRPDGSPHVVPFVFAMEGDTLWWAVDRKPKATQHLQRLENIRANPSVEVVVDHYEEDWSKVWWVRAKGDARILEHSDGSARTHALGLLVARYGQYLNEPPEGPVVKVTLSSITGWEASPST
jgi:PPOX class probable F420-dependent enzyme